MSIRTTSSPWVRGVVDMFEASGLDTAHILRAADLDPAVLGDPDARVPTEKMSRLWRIAVEVSGDPTIGLAHPHVPKPGNFDIVGYSMLSSRTLHDALTAFSRHMRLVSDAAELTLDDDGAAVGVRFDLFGGREPIPRQRIEFDLLTILTFCRWVSGRHVVPLRLSLVYPEPGDVRHFVESFQCPLHFDAAFNGLIFARDDLAVALPAFNPTVAALHDGLVRERLAAFDGTGLGVRVCREIARCLVTGVPRREAVARALSIGERTMQRRLHEEGTTFERLLDLTRCDLAQHYLARPDLSVAEVAYLLGFADPGTFFRACRRWFGASPGQFRTRVLARHRVAG